MQRLQEGGYIRFEPVERGPKYPVFLNKYPLREGPLKGYRLNAKASFDIGRPVYDWPKGGAAGIGFSYSGGESVVKFEAFDPATGLAATGYEMSVDGPETDQKVTTECPQNGQSAPPFCPQGDHRKVRNIGVQSNRAQRVIVTEIRHYSRTLGDLNLTTQLSAYDDFMQNGQSTDLRQSQVLLDAEEDEDQEDKSGDNGSAPPPARPQDAGSHPPAVVRTPPRPKEGNKPPAPPPPLPDTTRELAGLLLQLAGWNPITEANLNTAGRYLNPLVTEHGADAVRQNITWAFEGGDGYWKKRLTEASSPAAFFAKSYPTIQDQASAPARPVSTTPANVLHGKYTSGPLRGCAYDAEAATPGTAKYKSIHCFD
jgi:hypothetical protein